MSNETLEIRGEPIMATFAYLDALVKRSDEQNFGRNPNVLFISNYLDVEKALSKTKKGNTFRDGEKTIIIKRAVYKLPNEDIHEISYELFKQLGDPRKLQITPLYSSIK